MATRRDAREWCLQVLFHLDLNPTEPDKALDWFWKEHPDVPDKSRLFVSEMVKGVMANRDVIDATLQKYADNWDLPRMNSVDRNVLRMAIYEMQNRGDIPPIVSINEAVDVARYFSSVDSGRFVNGILDRIRKDLGRPSRTPHKSA